MKNWLFELGQGSHIQGPAQKKSGRITTERPIDFHTRKPEPKKLAGLQPSARLISRAEKSGRITTERPIDFHTQNIILGTFLARIRIANRGLGRTLATGPAK